MSSRKKSPRLELIRDTAIFQLKLVADGFRDAALIPVSLVATLVGLIRGGKDCDREYRQVIKIGRRTERWINLFGHQAPLGIEHPAGSIDRVLEQVESVVIDQYRKGRSASEVKAAVRKSLREKEAPGAGEEQGSDRPQ